MTVPFSDEELKQIQERAMREGNEFMLKVLQTYLRNNSKIPSGINGNSPIVGGPPLLPKTATEIAMQKKEANAHLQAIQAKKAMYEAMYSGVFDGPLSGYPVRAKPKRFKQITMQGNTGLTEDMAFQLLAGRLRVGEGAVWPFAHLSMHIAQDKSYLFVVAKGGPVMLEDDTHMFPSDDLIGKLRLLMG